MQHKKIITTAIAYANGAPHIGHAFEFITADVHTRHAKLEGDDIFFVTGMDEHGQKIEQKAKEQGVSVHDFVSKHADTFKSLDAELGIDYDFFVRTSDKEKHYIGAQALWNKLVLAGDLEKRTYTALYCVGCEAFKTDKDLNEEGQCPDHLTKPEQVEEENYFFKLSKYSEIIKEKIMSNELQILPAARKNEIVALLERGLDDVSFSRPVSKVSWGIPVPGDNTQVMYVWCDALSNYITSIGYGTDSFDEERWNDATHVIGKDILRFHAAIWPGMLLSAGLPLPKKILVHGHITSGGQKMSKSIGNVIDPQEVIDLLDPSCHELKGEALRFILLYKIPSFDDGDLTLDSIKETYTAHLANGIGNLTNRIMKMVSSNEISTNDYLEKNGRTTEESNPVFVSYQDALASYDLKRAVESVTLAISLLDSDIQTNQPFKVIKDDKQKGEQMIIELVKKLSEIAYLLAPFMPKTSTKILHCIERGEMPEVPLFNRLP